MKSSDQVQDTARAWLADAIASIGFLTRIPVHDLLPDPHPPLARSMRGFPLAGLLIGVIGAVAFALCGILHVPLLVTASISLGAMLLATGALHADGLADMADGFGGGASCERKLEIMRDTHIGSFGVVVLVLVLLTEVASLAAINGPDRFAAPAVIVASAILSRTAMVWLMHTLPPARTDGLSAAAGRPSSDTVLAALILGGVLAGLLLLIAGGMMTAAFAIAACALAALAVRALAQQQIGGQTGDVCGATQMICEAATLAATAASLS
ncbi:adenosylcobinamide-GDP ribazoletransferase [soil metagenome]